MASPWIAEHLVRSRRDDLRRTAEARKLVIELRSEREANRFSRMVGVILIRAGRRLAGDPDAGETGNPSAAVGGSASWRWSHRPA